MKKNRTVPFIFTFIVVLFMFTLLIGHGFTENSVDNRKKPSSEPNISSSIELLIFSSTKYSHERNLVKIYERIRPALLKYGRIFIALADLNDDGIKEIFAYIDIFEYCGQQIGCPLNIYKVKNGKLISLLRPNFIDGFPMFIEIDNTGKQNEIGILTSTTMGWRDIALKGGTVWKWNGKDYGYRGN